MRLHSFLLVLALGLSEAHLPTEYLKTPDIIAYWGYPVEIYDVTTADGYILQLHRIPHAKGATPPTAANPLPVIFMQHGLEGTSSNWVTNLPNHSAAFIFADAGFDVWLGNFRGNTYSTRHASLSVYGREYWQFSWDQMAKYDLPAMMNFVLLTSNQPSMDYIGHSMGTMTAFALFSYDQTWVSKVKTFHALGPVARVGHVGGLIKYIAPFVNEISWMLEMFGEEQFLPSNIFMKLMTDEMCGFFHMNNPLCDCIYFLIGGIDSSHMNATRVPVYVAHSPGGTSTMNMQHFGQGVSSNKFQAFDYLFASTNKEHYGTATPPIYDISKVGVKTHLYWGQQDILADPKDVAFIANTMSPSALVENNAFRGFNHLDFLWGRDAPKEVYAKIMAVVKK